MAKSVVRVDSKPLTHLSVFVYSVSNDNRLYHARFSVPRKMELSDAFLSLGTGEVVAASSGGGGNAKYSVGFRLDRVQASAVAKALGVPRQDRRNLARGLRHGCRPKAGKVHAINGPIPIEFWASSSKLVDVEKGGRNRGPRNDRFRFEITRHGKSVATREAMNFGGLSTIHVLGPGKQRFTDQSDLRRWAELRQPGLYRVTCHYELTLFEVGQGHSSDWPKNAHRTWSASPKSSFTIRVR